MSTPSKQISIANQIYQKIFNLRAIQSQTHTIDFRFLASTLDVVKCRHDIRAIRARFCREM
jgi:hypothetical protein